MVVHANQARRRWAQRFDECLSGFPFAEESLRLLASNGVDRHVLIDLLGWYTSPGVQQDLGTIRAWAGTTAAKLLKVQKLARKLAKELAGVLPDFEIYGLTAWQSSKELAAIHSLRSAAESADDLRKHYKEISSRRGKGRNEEILVHLCLTVEAQTGTQHWSDIAYLLEVAFAVRGNIEDWTPDSLRKIVERFERTCPKVYKGMRSCIFEQYSARPKPSCVIKRSTRNRRTKARPWQPIIHGG
jgi:hypothetical protein